MKGFFIDRTSVCHWIFLCDDKIEHTFILSETPILSTVHYTLDMSGFRPKLLDGVRLPWSEKVHNVYFKGLEYTIIPPELQPCEISEYSRWYNFFIDFHVQRLVPMRNPILAYKYIEFGQWNELVYEFGGVEPMVLSRFANYKTTESLNKRSKTDNVVNNDLIQDAVLLQLITRCMKQTGRVWLEYDDVKVILHESYSHVSKRLIEKGVLLEKNDCLALKWAVDLIPTPESCEHSYGAIPEKCSDEKVIIADRSMAVDPWIDTHILPNIMIPARWINDPRIFPCNDIQWFTNLGILLTTIRQQTLNRKCVTFSRTGNIEFSYNTALICDKVCSVKPGKIGYTLIDEESIPNSTIFNQTKFVSAQKFDDLNVWTKTPSDVFVFIIQVNSDKRWLSWFNLLKGEKIICGILK